MVTLMAEALSVIKSDFPGGGCDELADPRQILETSVERLARHRWMLEAADR